MMNTAIYAGTFDPITNGHLDIIQRAVVFFDKLIVAVAQNPSKNPLIPLTERVALVRESCQHLPKVEVIGFSGLLADLALAYQANTLIRGIRGSEDIDYEIHLAQLNQQLAKGLETLFFPPAIQWRYLSSTMVREVYRHQGEITPFVPLPVAKWLNKR